MTPDSANQATSSSDVFVSYASADAGIAKSIVENLEQHGLKCWMAPRDVKPGAPYAAAIVQGINEANALVLVLSASSVQSDHVAREVERAASKHKSIYAFRIDAAPLNAELEYFLSKSQWIDVAALGMPAALVKLKAAVGQGTAQIGGAANIGIQAKAPELDGRNRRIAVVVSVVAGVGIAVALGLHFWRSNHRGGEAVTASGPVPSAAAPISDKSIAVLPFVDMSEKKDQEYFADGMAEEILNLLAKISSLKVIGRTSSFQFRGENDLREIGTKLGVAYVLEGSVRRSADRVRVTAQLIDTRDGSHRWSETYDRPASDALQLQDEIAATLSRSLEIGIGADSPQSKRRMKNDEAYDLYLRGRYAADRGDADGLSAATAYLRQALDLDPTFADAAVVLAGTYWAQGSSSLAPSNVFEQARRAAEYALKLDPGLGLAHAVLGGIHTDYDWDWPAADREFKQALALAPHNGLVLSLAADLTIAIGHLDVARQMLKESLAYDPLLVDAYMNLAWTELCSGRYAEAEAAARRAVEIDPLYEWGHIYVGDALIYRGDPGAALVEIKREANPMAQAVGLALAYHALGREVDSDSALNKLIAEGAINYAYEIAEVYAYRDRRQDTLKWLDRAFVQKDASLKWIKRDLTFAKLESDLRYKAFLKKMNLPE